MPSYYEEYETYESPYYSSSARYYKGQLKAAEERNRVLLEERNDAEARAKALGARIDNIKSLIECSEILDRLFGDDRRKEDPNYLPAVAISDLKYVLEK